MLLQFKHKVLERSKSRTFLTLFNNTVSVALYKVITLSLAFMVTSPTIVIVVKQWIQRWDPLLHKYGCNCHTTMVWLPWLPDFALDSPRLTQVLNPPHKFKPLPFKNG
jgi:hypothetical protein